MTIGDVIEALDRIAPPALAEQWDNVGLLLGDRGAPCSRVVVALEVDGALVGRAAETGAELIISHHPPLLGRVSRLTADSPAGRLLLKAARQGIALAAAHTNYDAAPGGTSDVLADLLGLTGIEPLGRSRAADQAKVVVFTPPADLEAVIRALSDSGAGAIGNYRECTFRTPGTGTFRGLEGAHPTIGRVGHRQEAEELRLEAIVPLALADRAVAAVRAAHSYEEPAIDVYPLHGGPSALGIGRMGQLARPMQARRFVARVKKRLGVPAVRAVGDLRRKVRQIAVCGGSGGDYIERAAEAGCQLYVTGDVSHHRALDAAAHGLIVVDAGHAATEAPAIEPLARRLREACPGIAFRASVAGAAGPYRLV